MKILKPGKVEQRKFVCPNCECEFVLYKSEAMRSMDLEYRYHYWAQCPCRDQISWDKGEPYEEPTQSDRDRLGELIFMSCVMDTDTAWEIADALIANGVTFREDENAKN